LGALESLKQHLFSWRIVIEVLSVNNINSGPIRPRLSSAIS